MRKFASIGLMIVLALGAEAGVFAAQFSGSVTGTAFSSDMRPLANVSVQLRNTDTGQMVATTTTTASGSFSFAGLPPGNYLAEMVDASGRITGIGMPISVGVGGSASTSVIALATKLSAGGFKLFGMGPVTSMAVLGAAAAASVTAVVTTRPDASPSR